jgi:hypothetical protein
MRISTAAVALLTGICFTTASLAATVNAVSGQVLVNKGDGYQQVAGATEANPGDTVVVNPGGSGSIVYPDGCVVQVQPGTVATIAPSSPCTAGSGFNTTTFAIGALVIGGGVGGAILLGQGGDKGSSP